MAGLSLWNWIIVLAAIAGPVILIVTIIWLAVGLLRRSRNAAGSAPSHAVSQILATLEQIMSKASRWQGVNLCSFSFEKLFMVFFNFCEHIAF